MVFKLSISGRSIRGDVRVLLVDDTGIRIGSSGRVLYIVFKPYLGVLYS